MSIRTLLQITLAVSVVGIIGGSALYFAGSPRASVGLSARAPELKEPGQAVVARAQAGDPAAQLQVGNWTLDKAIHADDYRQAAEWLAKAAASGNPEAQYRLGTLYQSGRVADPGSTNALYWFQRAAAQNHVAALYNIGSMYGTGQGVALDPQTAVRYLRQAAELGNIYAQFNMGRRCAEGQGIATNLIEAWKWYALAESGGIPSAQEPRGAVESRLTAAELAEARRAAQEVRKRLAAVHE
jgi:TPR repeat protein